MSPARMGFARAPGSERPRRRGPASQPKLKPNPGSDPPSPRPHEIQPYAEWAAVGRIDRSLWGKGGTGPRPTKEGQADLLRREPRAGPSKPQPRPLRGGKGADREARHQDFCAWQPLGTLITGGIALGLPNLKLTFSQTATAPSPADRQPADFEEPISAIQPSLPPSCFPETPDPGARRPLARACRCGAHLAAGSKPGLPASGRAGFKADQKHHADLHAQIGGRGH